MNSEKVKEIKKALECMSGLCKDSLTDFCFNCEVDKKFDEESACREALTLINELESENEILHRDFVVKAYDELRAENKQLRIANKLYAVELGKKDKKEYENLITNIRLETLKEFREKYKEALKEAVKGENVNCFVESLKIFDKTIEEKICDLK